MIDESYTNVTMSCLKRAGGNMIEAEKLADCSYFEYYYRIAMHNKYCEWHEEEIKKKTK